MENVQLVQQVNKEMALQLPEKISPDELREKLAAHINRLIQQNFEQLVSLLYRIDVSEAKIKTLLQHNPGEDAGDIIAALIIERQLEKIKIREQFKRSSSDDAGLERW